MLSNLSARQRILIAVSGTVVLAAVAFSFLFRDPAGQPSDLVTPSASPSDSLSSQDRVLLERLSKELAVKYSTYDQPDSPSYLASIRPYLTEDFYTQTVEEIDRYKGRIAPTSSSAAVKDVKVVESTFDSAIVTFRITVKTPTFEHSDEGEIRWKKRGDRWVALYILNDTSSQNRQKYGD